MVVYTQIALDNLQVFDWDAAKVYEMYAREKSNYAAQIY
jgi:hypothetical protein